MLVGAVTAMLLLNPLVKGKIKKESEHDLKNGSFNLKEVIWEG